MLVVHQTGNKAKIDDVNSIGSLTCYDRRIRPRPLQVAGSGLLSQMQENLPTEQMYLRILYKSGVTSGLTKSPSACCLTNIYIR